MRGIVLVIFLSGLLITEAVAQNGYEHIYGGQLADWFLTVSPLKNGGAVAGGATRSFGLGDANNYDGWLVLMDENGDTLWTRSFGTLGNEEVYFAGEVSGKIIGAGYHISPMNATLDFYAVQFNEAGEWQWENFYGGSGTEACYGGAVTADGRIILCGYSTTFTNGGTDVFAVLIDSNGNQLDQANFGSAATEVANAVAVTGDGGFVFAGYSNSVDPLFNLYLVKADSDLNLVWSKDFAGATEGLGFSVTEDLDGNIWLLGYEIGSPDTSYTTLIRTDANGENAVKFKPGHPGDFGRDIALAADGKILVSGVAGSIDQAAEMWLLKIDGEGNELWSQYLGGAANEYAYAVATDESGNIFLAGETEGFGFLQFDGYAVKLDSMANIPCPSGVSFVLSNDTICEDENVFMTNTSVSSQQFTWLVNGNEFSEGTNAGYYFSAPAGYEVTLAACNVSESKPVTVHPKPPAHFTYSIAGNTVNFMLDPGIQVQHISWNFGDGSPLNTVELNPAHTYPAIFSYWVEVTVTDSSGCDSSYAEQLDFPTELANISSSGFAVFPNPANDHFIVELSEYNSPSRLLLLDGNGKKIREEMITGSRARIDVDLNPGFYLLAIQTDEKIDRSSLIIAD